MIVNPGKFQAIIFDKHKENHTKQMISKVSKCIKSTKLYLK